MKSTAAAIYNGLVDLYGAANVFHGVAREATFPYQTFTVGAAALPMRNTGALNKNAIDQVPFTVHVWSKSSTQAADRCNEIRDYFLREKLDVKRHYCLRVTVTSVEVSEDPEPDEDGQAVWHGIVIFETWLTRDYYESSSSETSNSSRSASSRTASSLSTASTATSASASSASTSNSTASASSASTATSASTYSASSATASSATSTSDSSASPLGMSSESSSTDPYSESSVIGVHSSSSSASSPEDDI